jgi:TatD DNase family protein
MYLDAHSHLHLYEDAELGDVLRSVEEHRILTLSVSLDVSSFIRTEQIAAGSALVVPSFGVHPWEAPQVAGSLGDLETHVERSPMIGEIGLDHRFVTDQSQWEPQRVVFEWFLAKAVEEEKLVSVHCVGAEPETADLLAKYGLTRGIIHWYSGPIEVLHQMINSGLMFSVGVEVLHSDHIRSLARAIPANQLLTETDNPGGPREITGQSGYPELIIEVVDELARIRDTTTTEIAATVLSNISKLISEDKYLQPWGSYLDGA